MSQSSAVPECRHILSCGRKCRGIALRGQTHCYRHSNERAYTARNRRSRGCIELPTIEDHDSIRMAINQIITALTQRRIEEQLAGRLLYAIQIAQNSINRTKEVNPAEMVTDYIEDPSGNIALEESDADTAVPAEEEPAHQNKAVILSGFTASGSPRTGPGPRGEGERKIRLSS